MFNFPAICIANGTAILLLLIILSSSKRPIRHGFLDEKLYFAMVILNVLQCIIETVVFFMDGKMAYGFHALLIVLNVILFVNNIILPLAYIVNNNLIIIKKVKRPFA